MLSLVLLCSLILEYFNKNVTQQINAILTLGPAVILVIMYVKTFKTDVIAFNVNFQYLILYINVWNQKKNVQIIDIAAFICWVTFLLKYSKIKEQRSTSDNIIRIYIHIQTASLLVVAQKHLHQIYPRFLQNIRPVF
jgi:hypothetical protein